ncbi:AMP-binding protein [Terrilactibacillus sp. S3-3]|nr:AMP-binding protein [Terrilactibacillus sp. S3-3]
MSEVILFTSGTESKPKGVILTHRNIFANIKQAFDHIEVKQTDRIFNPLPLFHSFGMTVGAILPLVTSVNHFYFPRRLVIGRFQRRFIRIKVRFLFQQIHFSSITPTMPLKNNSGH